VAGNELEDHGSVPSWGTVVAVRHLVAPTDCVTRLAPHEMYTWGKAARA
jgi:hypothetical protein